jgi:hypothetical protein
MRAPPCRRAQVAMMRVAWPSPAPSKLGSRDRRATETVLAHLRQDPSCPHERSRSGGLPKALRFRQPRLLASFWPARCLPCVAVPAGTGTQIGVLWHPDDGVAVGALGSVRYGAGCGGDVTVRRCRDVLAVGYQLGGGVSRQRSHCCWQYGGFETTDAWTERECLTISTRASA